MTATQTLTRTSTWVVDPSHSTAHFAVKHLGVSTVRGTFSGINGVIELDEESFIDSRIEVSIPVATISTRDEKRDEHLRSGDFFEEASYPEAAFLSERVSGNPNGFRVLGDLTIRGVTREVTLEGKQLGRETSPWGSEVIGFEATTEINRKDFGLNWNVALEKGGLLVGEKVKITLDVEAIRQL